MQKMKRALLAAGMTAAMTASMAVAQNGRNVGPPDDESPDRAACDMKNLDTMHGCWDCFAWMANSCSKLPGDDHRRSCLEAANDFFIWCMDRLKDDGTESQRANAQWPEFQSWPVGTQLERPFIWPEGADRVETWVWIEDGREHNETPVVEQKPDDSWNVVINWPEMSLGDNGSVGIVLVWFDGETMVEVLADLVLLTSDMDGDGEVRGDDLETILHNFATGRLDMRELIRALR